MAIYDQETLKDRQIFMFSHNSDGFLGTSDISEIKSVSDYAQTERVALTKLLDIRMLGDLQFRVS
jgi:hypothetical protein